MMKFVQQLMAEDILETRVIYVRLRRSSILESAVDNVYCLKYVINTGGINVIDQMITTYQYDKN